MEKEDLHQRHKDTESGTITPTSLQTPAHEGTQRHLQARHLQMIAIGGTIGTGLFVNSGDVIAGAGALGALLAYAIAGITVFSVVMSLGEMATLIPVSGSFNAYAERFVDRSLGFTSGWAYWFSWAITLPIELVACGIFLGKWLPDTPTWIFYIIILVILLAINLFSVKGYGEVEYWLSLLKIFAIVVFIITCFIIVFRDHLGFSTWDAAGLGPFAASGDGATAGLNLLGAMVGACFAFGGTELVGITAGEAANPRVSVPRAINDTFWRIMIFYIATIFLIGLVLPANVLVDLASAGKLVKSPFVIVFNNANIPGAADIMNFIGLVAVFSAGNSSVYACSRTMMSLCDNGHGPKILARTTKWGVPVIATLISCAFGGISLFGTLLKIGEGDLFLWLINLVGLNVIITWAFISLTHIRFRKAYLAQGHDLADLPYRAPLGLYGDYISLVINIVVVVFSGITGNLAGDPFVIADFMAAYCSIFLYIILYFGHKAITRCPFVPLMEVDLITGHVSNFDEPVEEAVENDLSFKGRARKILHFIA